MKVSYQTDERLVLGKARKSACAERAAHADAGVIVDYFRCTVQREALFAAQIPSKGELIDGLQLDGEIVQDLRCSISPSSRGFLPGEALARP